VTYYGIILPRYWTGTTGRALQKRGGKDAQILGAYLFSNEHANMIGLYRLPTVTIRAELGLTPASIVKAFQALSEEQFAFYDEATGYVWVREMARFRLQISDEIFKTSDKRRIGAERLYESIPENPYLGPFFDKYGRVLQLKRRRESSLRGGGDVPLQSPPQLVVPARTFEGASKGYGRGFEGPSKPVTDQRSDQRSVHQKDQSSAASAARPSPAGADDETRKNIGVITKIAHEAIDQVGSDSAELSDTVKSLCAIRGIAYDSTVVNAAIDSARHQRNLRSAAR
jgi:hypothetical protein